MIKTIILTVFLGLWFAAAAGGDEILLKNGNVIEGKIIRETDKKVVLNIPGRPGPNGQVSYIKMSFPKSRVRRITRNATLFKDAERTTSAPPEARLTQEEPATTATPTPPPEATKTEKPKEKKTTAVKEENPKGKAEKNTPAELDPEMKKLVDALITNLKDIKENTRTAAMDRLTAIGKDALPAIVTTLISSKSNLQRISIIKVLRRLKGEAKPAVHALIDQLNGGIRARSRMRQAWWALKDITGKKIYFNEDHGKSKRNADSKKWLLWLESVAEEYPDQLGYEEEADKKKGI